ncbi:hypothetical protein [Saccharicrinis fermentans]|uniref:Uncharacterized protein n=1 Tax=Saccharicrinis fermentans DSM 9555 = JCM 21142 TaxID=869213 RepID=W7YEB9_9BACT|nr:hypothetical protein [Saccharicrinis fermentans]GAF05813.1 hypothetical protein JCM21142_114567 [Saccharicrinis fermentans DSM 9555 = JCM 21142]
MTDKQKVEQKLCSVNLAISEINKRIKDETIGKAIQLIKKRSMLMLKQEVYKNWLSNSFASKKLTYNITEVVNNNK